MTSTNRRTFLAYGAAGAATAAAAVTLAGCSEDAPSPEPTTQDSPAEAVAPSGLAKAILADQPQLYVDFQDDADVKDPADRSTHGRRTVLHGKRWWRNDALSLAAPNAVGRSFHSGTSNDPAWLEVPDAKQWMAKAPKTGMTVEMWLCQDEANFNQTLVKLHSSKDETGWSFGFRQDGTGLVAEGPGFKSAEFTTEKIPGAWHHVALSLDAKGKVAGYLDGKPVGTGDVGPFVGEVKDVSFGTKDGKGASLSGQWAHYAVYDTPLPADRIKAHHEAGIAPADPVVRGVDAFFGGPKQYYGQFTNCEVLADEKRFPIGEWWLNGTVEDLPDERKYAHGAVVVDPKVTPESLRKAGLWAIRTTGMDMSGKPGAETIGWLPEDEADMDAEKMKTLAQNLKKHPDGYLAYSNYGTGVTISTIDRYRVRPLIDRPDIHQVSADLYSYCEQPTMRKQVAEAWGIPEEQVRRAAAHGMVVERCRAFLSRPLPVWGVVAIGHANVVRKGEPGWGSVPSADEVEGAIMSCITAGASGILLFPQSFPDDKPAPVWNAKSTYKAGDTVRDPKEEHRFWFARTDPKPGVNPNQVTDDSWLSWRPNPFGVRNDGHYARGVSERVAQVTQRLQELAPVLYSKSQPKAVNDKLHTRFWPETPDGHSYLMAMQRIAHTSGSYDLRLPDGTKAKEVEVVGADRTIQIKDGVFTDEFKNEWEHRVYRWKA